MILLTGAARAQTFTDLNFEQATIVPTDALPEDGEAIAPFGVVANESLARMDCRIRHHVNQRHLGRTRSSRRDRSPDGWRTGKPSNRSIGSRSGVAIDGNFSVNLYATQHYLGDSQAAATASISQLGQIPLGTKSIEFLISGSSWSVNGFGVEAQPTVTFDGNLISVAPLSENNGITTMIGDVSEYAGMEGELPFPPYLALSPA